MEFVSCNVCGVDDAALLYRGKDRLLSGSDVFDLVCCRRCGLIYVNPRPTLAEMEHYYPTTYEPYTRQAQMAGWYPRLRYRVAIARMCRIAANKQESGRLLDVGCGDGDFMAGMQQRGWQVSGLDTSPVAVELARGKGLDVFLGLLSNADYSEASFDLITMWDVLEHLHDPAAYLLQIGRLLRPGGRFVVTLPNPHSLDFRLFGPAWTGLDTPRHLYVFVRPALLALLQRAGLEVESARCRYGGQRVSIWSLEWLADERMSSQRTNQLVKRLIYSPIWYWGWRPWYLLIDALGLGSSITYSCRRAHS
jgi:SAM-dependent methyltransferase